MKKQTILLVAPVTCYPSNQGNAARIASVYECLISLGHDVYYLHLPDGPFDHKLMTARLGNKYLYLKKRLYTVATWLKLRSLTTIILQQSSRHVKIDDFISRNDISFYKKQLALIKPDVVWVNYTYYSKLFNATPKGILKVLDTHDAIHLRFKSIFSNRPAHRTLSVSIADEIACINRADRIICITEEDENFFKSNECTKKTYKISHVVTFRPTIVTEDKNNLLFLASNYFVYSEAITAFIKNIWPRLIKLRPQTQLFIAGNVCKAIDKHLPYKNITILGQVPDLQELYNNTAIAINPVAVGSGLKIKIIEALAFGKPVITMPAGTQGLEAFINKGLTVADSDNEWIDSIIALLDDKQRYNAQIHNLNYDIARYNESNNAIFKQVLDD